MFQSFGKSCAKTIALKIKSVLILYILLSNEHASEKLETAGVTSCRICELDYEPIGDRKRCKLACSHVICEICAKDWLSRNGLCPFCKHPFNHLEPIHLS